jgi:hypothetical protein
MPRDINVDFLAVDEIQLAADLDRGHIFTNRLLHWRGKQETLLIGAAHGANNFRAFSKRNDFRVHVYQNYPLQAIRKFLVCQRARLS